MTHEEILHELVADFIYSKYEYKPIGNNDELIIAFIEYLKHKLSK